MIKYHDNYNGQQYDENGVLTDNWNADGDYADNEYASVYFRINCPAYSFNGPAFKDKAEEDAFITEKMTVFNSLGWEISREERNGCCMEVRKGKAELYLHPQEFSGNILKRDVKQIAEALESNKTFSLRWVDIYGTVYDMTDDEYLEYLNTQKEKARELLFKYCKTTRTEKYMYWNDATRDIGKRIMLPRIGCKSNYEPSGIDLEFVSDVIANMVTEGYLIQTEWNGLDFVRTRNKTELKQAKLKAIA